MSPLQETIDKKRSLCEGKDSAHGKALGRGNSQLLTYPRVREPEPGPRLVSSSPSPTTPSASSVAVVVAFAILGVLDSVIRSKLLLSSVGGGVSVA